MEKIIKQVLGAPCISIRYGKELSIKNKWKEIAAINDSEKRNFEVTKLIETMENNKSENGFFAKDDVIEINCLFMQSFMIDDINIYYNFFANLNSLIESNQIVSAKMYGKAIIKTLGEYFGKLIDNETKRRKLTSEIIDDNDNIISSSVKNLKGQDCAACVEYASLSHNLWLLAGIKSYYVLNKEISHAFNVLEYSNGFMLFDLAQNKIAKLPNNPISAIENGELLMLDNFIYSNEEPNKTL